MSQISFNLSKIRSKEEIAAFKKFTEVKKEVQEMGDSLKKIDECPADLASGQKGLVVVDKVDFNNVSYTGSISYDAGRGDLKNLNLFGSTTNITNDTYFNYKAVQNEEKNIIFTNEADRETYTVEQIKSGDSYYGAGEYKYMEYGLAETFIVNKSNGTITYICKPTPAKL